MKKIVIICIFCIAYAYSQTTDQISESLDGITIPSQIISDWETVDRTAALGYKAVITSIASGLPETNARIINSELQNISNRAPSDPAWKNLYVKACHFRRISRMKPYTDRLKRIVFTSHYTMGALFQGFQEGIGGNKCSNYKAGASLCLLTMDNYYSQFKKIHESTAGVIKDPDVSYDGNKILFAETKDNNGFHLYELDATNPQTIRQITSNPPNLRISDFDGCYLPNGNILFQSSRNFGLVDCFTNISSNLFICDKDGKYLRRIGYDQVQTFYPTMMEDGKVLYTRWEYNDRSQVYSMGLFTMNPDGTNQTEFYGNQSWWPTSIIQARNIPGSTKVMAIFSGHHTTYSGEIGIIDPNIGRQEGQGISLIAPVRKPTIVRRDNGGVNFLFQTPYPFDEQCFLVGYRPNTSSNFSLYFMNVNGERELLAWGNGQSLNRPVPLTARKVPHQFAPMVDYKNNTGAFTMSNIYVGTGLPGIPKGTIKRLRVVALDYRIDNPIGYTFWRTNEFDLSAHTYTPIARSSGSWDVKRILGETPVYSDGSAAFIVPARTPVFFQALDSLGRVVQTMRSWSTLMPGETFSCVGCHEDKNSAPPVEGVPIAIIPKPLEPFHGIENQGFSFPKHVQPILNDKCVRCHNASHSKGLDLRADPIYASNLSSAWKTEFNDRDYNARKSWNLSYLELTEIRGKYVNWNITQSYPTGLAPNSTGSVKSPLISRLHSGHSNLSLSKKELDILSAWVDLCIPHSGTYTEGMNSTDANAYNNSVKRKTQWEAIENINIQEFIDAGQYGVVSTRHNISNLNSSKQARPMLLNLSNRNLYVVFPAMGNFTLFDLTGRKILSIPCQSTDASRNFQITLPDNLPSGTYIGHFKSSARNAKNNVSQPVFIH